MPEHHRLSLVISAIVGGGAVQLAFQACGSVSSRPDAHAASDAPAPLVTDWMSYAPTLTSKATGTAIGNVNTVGSWRRVGDTVEIRILTVISGTPTGIGCADYWKWGLPAGLKIDTMKFSSLSGFGDAYQLGSGHAKLAISTNTGVDLFAVGDQDCFVNGSAPFTFGKDGAVSFVASFPVIGWTTTQ